MANPAFVSAKLGAEDKFILKKTLLPLASNQPNNGQFMNSFTTMIAILIHFFSEREQKRDKAISPVQQISENEEKKRIIYKEEINYIARNKKSFVIVFQKDV